MKICLKIFICKKIEDSRSFWSLNMGKDWYVIDVKEKVLTEEAIDAFYYRNEKTGEYFFRVVWGDWPTYCSAHEGKVFDIYIGNKEDAIKSITQFNEISKRLKKGEFINFQDSHKHNFQFYRVDNVVYKLFGFIDCDSELINDFGVNKGKPIANVIH